MTKLWHMKQTIIVVKSNLNQNFTSLCPTYDLFKCKAKLEMFAHLGINFDSFRPLCIRTNTTHPI